MLRFVTLIPVVVTVAAALKFGATALDQEVSSRPLAIELASVEGKKLPLAICGAPREMEYGLAFYRNQTDPRATRAPPAPFPRRSICSSLRRRGKITSLGGR